MKVFLGFSCGISLAISMVSSNKSEWYVHGGTCPPHTPEFEWRQRLINKWNAISNFFMGIFVYSGLLIFFTP